MASNTGLYDDSDSESISNMLSPSDGYFSQRAQPSNVMVPDPSQRNTQADKEREAREEGEASRAQEASSAAASQRAYSNHSRRSSAFSPSSVPSTRRYDPAFQEPVQSDRTPLLPPAPPAYEPPAEDSPYRHAHSASQSSTATGYNTMGGPGPIFLPDRDPEDLGGARSPGDGGRRRGLWGRVSDRIYENTDRIAKWVLVLLAIGAGIGFIINTVRRIDSHGDVHYGNVSSVYEFKESFDLMMI